MGRSTLIACLVALLACQAYGARHLTSSSSLTSYTANINTGPAGIDASVVVTQGEDKTTATWFVKINSVDAAFVCDQPGLKWHVHEKPVVTTCEGSDTGLHWDPTFGCGAKSQHKDLLCKALAPARGDKSIQSCDITQPSTCEFGDLNGKMGLLDWTKSGTQVFVDTYSDNIENYFGKSLVFHCGGPRVACGNFA